MGHPQPWTVVPGQRRLVQLQPNLSSPGQAPQKENHRLNTPMKVGDVKFLIRGVQVVVRQPKAHQDSGDLKVTLEVSHDGNRAAATDKDRLLAEYLAQSPSRRLDITIVRLHHDRVARMDQPDPQLNALGLYRLNIGLVLGKNLLRVHVGNQAEGDLGRGFRRNHGFRAGAGKTSGHSVYIHGGPGPGPLQHRKSRLPGKLPGSDFRSTIFLLVKRQALPGFELVGGRRGHLVIKTRNQDVAVRVFELCDHLGQRDERIRRRAAKRSGMQIAPGSLGFQFGVDHAAQADAQSRQTRGKHRGIRDQGKVGLELLRVFAQELGNSLPSHLLFAFDQHPDIDGQASSGGLEQRLQGLHVAVHLSLVVDRAPGIEIAVAFGGLKRGEIHSSSGSGGWTS